MVTRIQSPNELKGGVDYHWMSVADLEEAERETKPEEIGLFFQDPHGKGCTLFIEKGKSQCA